jgi:ABC-2 type transport system permease protein
VTRVVAVARREYLERVRSKAFLVTTVLGPLIMAAFMMGPGLLMQRQRGKPLRLAVVDVAGVLKQDVETALGDRRTEGGEQRFQVQAAPEGSPEQARAALNEKVLAGSLDGYLFFPPDALAESRAEYYGKNVTNVMDLGLMDSVVRDTFVARRLLGEGLAAERIAGLTRRPDVKRIRVTESGSHEDRGGTFLLSMILLTMLYSSLAMWGAALMNGVIEEKTNRVVEVMVSAMPTTQLFFGKLAGVGAAGLTQFTIWASVTALISAVGGAMASAQGFQMPEVSILVLVFFVVYFLLGYFLYGSLYMAVGASVNTVQEAQGLAFPVMMPLILGFIAFPVVLGSPDSALSVTLSLVPFFTPLLMFLRMTAVTPPAWQIAASVAIMILTIGGLTWLAARVYRVGILMYGKRPTFPEILRWVGRR